MNETTEQETPIDSRLKALKLRFNRDVTEAYQRHFKTLMRIREDYEEDLAKIEAVIQREKQWTLSDE